MNEADVWIPYCGMAPLPGELLARWNLDPVLLTVLGLSFFVGWRNVQAAPVAQHRFVAAFVLAAVLFISPFCALTSALFSARTVHHLALTALVAPLLAASLSNVRAHVSTAVAASLHAATFWAWHVPPAYEAALSNGLVYWIMQASLLWTALVLWRSVRSASLPAAIAALLATTVLMGLLGALLTFIDTPLYAPHAVAPIAWGLSPLEDQQLAGLIMWAPGSALYLVAALALAARWLADERRETAAT